MAQHHDDLTDAGARVVAISVDEPGQNAAMVDKLRLPFPLLSDPAGETVIKPLDVWHQERRVARPAVIVVDPSGGEVFRQVSRDFADRITDEELAGKVRALGLDPVKQDPPTSGSPEPGERAMAVELLPAYYRGARFAAKALSMRVPEAADEARTYIAELDRYTEAIRNLRAASEERR